MSEEGPVHKRRPIDDNLVKIDDYPKTVHSFNLENFSQYIDSHRAGVHTPAMVKVLETFRIRFHWVEFVG